MIATRLFNNDVIVKTKTIKTPLMMAVAFGPTLALRRGYFYSKEPRNQGNNIPVFLNSLDKIISRIYSKEPRNQGMACAVSP